MYRNYQHNWCCNNNNLYNLNQTPSCDLNCYPCECYCYYPITRYHQTYHKLSDMPPKRNTTNETSSGKNSAKLKKKTKTKTTRSSKNGVLSREEEDSVKDRKSSNTSSNSEYPRCSIPNGNNNIRLSHSESMVGSIGSGNNGTKNCDSYCNYQCVCTPLRGCADKPPIDFNLLTRNVMPIKQTYSGSGPSHHSSSVKQNYFSYTQPSFVRRASNEPTSQQPIKQTYSGSGPSYRMNSNSIKQNDNSYTADKLTSPINSKRIANNSRNSYTTQPSNVRRASNEPLSQQSHLHQVSKCKVCSICLHYDKKTSPFKNRSCACNCNLCRKTSPSSTSYARSPRQSFSSSKSCPQLDVINEEEAENEEYANFISNRSSQNSTDSYTKPEARSVPISVGPHETHKTLEDSCADFLNIVCDNILESVQKSVDCKLKEYSINVTENFESLEQKLEKSESAVKSLFKEVIENMNEQNKNNLEQIFTLLQNLVEKQTASQYAMAINNCQDTASQCEPEIKDENEFITDVVQDISNGNGLREENTMEAETESYDTNPSLNEKNSKEETTNNAKIDDGRMKKSINDAKPERCHCCHCNDENSAHTLPLYKSYSRSTAEEQIDQPIRSAEQNSITHNADSVGRNEVGSMDVNGEDDINVMTLPRKEDSSPRISSGRDDLRIVGKNKQLSPRKPFVKVSKKENIPIMELSKKYPPSEEVTSPRSSAARVLNAQHDTSPQMFTTFSLTSSGKTIFNCNCSKEWDGSDKPGVCVHKYDNNMDNYDTSGYATEPEDNNNPAASNSTRKKLQKKASKQHCMEMVNTSSGPETINEKHDSQICRRTSKNNTSKDRNASPTRLSRL